MLSMQPNIPPNPLVHNIDDLIWLVRHSLGVRYLAVATITVIAYEYIITFEREVSLIWRSKCSAPKILFFINRYLVSALLIFDCIIPTVHVSGAFCHFWLQWQSWPTLLSMISTDGILALRVWALYSRSKVMLVVLLVVYFANAIVLLSISGAQYAPFPGSNKVHVNPPLLPGCFANQKPSYIYGVWLSPLFLEVIFVCLIIYKAAPLLSNGRKAAPILSLFARDSLVYFIIIFGFLLTQVLFTKYGPGPISGVMLLGPTSAASSVAVTRMILNMKAQLLHEACIPDRAQHEFTSAINMRTLQFATRDSGEDSGTMAEGGGPT